MDIRNNNFAAAVDYLKRNGKIKTQKELAGIMGVSEDTITRILKGKRVTEDAISKLQNATDCIFNIQWLRGESDIMLTAEIRSKGEQDRINPHAQMPGADFSSWANAIIAGKDDAITALKREIAAKDETIATKDETIATQRGQLADKDALILSLQQQVAQAQQQVADLRHAIAIIQSKTVMESYSTPLGAAEHGSLQSHELK